MWRYQLIADGNIRLQLVRKLLFDLGEIAERFYLGQEEFGPGGNWKRDELGLTMVISERLGGDAISILFY